MKYIPFLVLLLFCCCKRSKEIVTEPATRPVKESAMPEVASDFLIEPGVRIGHIEINANAEQLDSLLGKPDFSDAAMGKAWTSWYSKSGGEKKRHELNIYTTYENNELMKKVVRLVRITSPKFETAHGSHTGDSFDKTKNAFPEIVRVADYDLTASNPVSMYDAIETGIAFEFANDTCIAITIHPKGRKVTQDYITLHPDMKLL